MDEGDVLRPVPAACVRPAAHARARCLRAPSRARTRAPCPPAHARVAACSRPLPACPAACVRRPGGRRRRPRAARAGELVRGQAWVISCCARRPAGTARASRPRARGRRRRRRRPRHAPPSSTPRHATAARGFTQRHRRGSGQGAARGSDGEGLCAVAAGELRMAAAAGGSARLPGSCARRRRRGAPPGGDLEAVRGGGLPAAAESTLPSFFYITYFLFVLTSGAHNPPNRFVFYWTDKWGPLSVSPSICAQFVISAFCEKPNSMW